MTGAYGNVGAVLFLTALTMFDAKTFFLIIAAITFFGALYCLAFLKEPRGSFAEEYHLTSVDYELIKGRKKKENN
jgi:NNP family nitrate/nitrite transporter-like MFS transporter